jgi:cytochrome c-type biogenesis protein CcmH
MRGPLPGSAVARKGAPAKQLQACHAGHDNARACRPFKGMTPLPNPQRWDQIPMSMYSFLAGVLTGAAVLAAASWLWRTVPAQKTSLRQTGLIAGGLVATFVLAAAAMYLTIARPRAAQAPAQAAAPHAMEPGGAAGQPPQSMQAATAGLAARLARSGGSDEQWELLAKSYEFLGRTEDARLARAHQVSPAAAAEAAGSQTGAPPSMQDALRAVAGAGAAGAQGDDAALRAQLEQKLKSNPKDVQALMGLAALDQDERQYAKAQERYRQLIALKAMTADTWADYADVLAALSSGSLPAEASQAIEHALALDPRHEKALWLKASFAYQEHRYADALALWKSLRATLPAGSPDIAAVDSNIAEAAQLASGAPAGELPAAATAGVAVSGTVSIDSHLAAQVSPEATLFIYARAAGEQGPPLAVLRLRAGSWPVSFRLDDSLAMIPTRKLSQFDKVIVEARVSSSGQAAPQSGDLYIKSDVIRPADGKKLTLVISQKIG